MQREKVELQRRWVLLAVLLASCGEGVLEVGAGEVEEGSALLSGAGFEAESMSQLGGYAQSVFSDPAASGGKARVYFREGEAFMDANVPVAAAGFTIRARADLCNGAPTLVVKLDGVQVLAAAVSSAFWANFPVAQPLSAGTHRFAIAFPNDAYLAGSCDRNLRVDVITFGASVTDAGPPPLVDAGTPGPVDAGSPLPVDAGVAPPADAGQGGAVLGVLEAEVMLPISGSPTVKNETGASGGKLLAFYRAGAAEGSLAIAQAATQLTVRARGDLCQGSPNLVVRLNGGVVFSTPVDSTTLADYTVGLNVPLGTHTLRVDFNNDHYVAGTCDRNLWVDRLTLSKGAGKCVPVTCSSQGKNCGSLSDGCGGTLDCGSCAAPATCGGSGIANVCGVATVPVDAGLPLPADAGSPSPGDIVIAAIGDINPGGVYGATTNPGRTAQNIRNMSPQYILGLGDFQYTAGTLSAIQGAFDRNFGDLKAKILPTAGPTHDIASATDPLGYTAYWGRDPFKGYSMDVGNWHLVSLPSAVYRYGVDTAGVTAWLNADLAANTKPCTLAFWHEPYWSRSTSNHPATAAGVQTAAVKPWIDALYAHRADLVLAGHQHNYQRFAPMRPDGTADSNGLRTFVVGSGGIGFYTFNNTPPNVDASNDNTYGVLKLTLKAGGYDFEFVPNTSGFVDSGSGVCHRAAAAPPAPDAGTPPASSGWVNLVNDQFDTGVLPAHWLPYPATWASANHSPAVYYSPSHCSVSGGYFHMLMKYEPQGIDGNPAATWYTCTASLAEGIETSPDFRVTLRWRLVPTNGGRAHHNMPLRWPNDECWPLGGEEDFFEGESATYDSADAFMHYGTGCSGQGNTQIHHSYGTIDLTQFHTYRFQRVTSGTNVEVKAYIDDLTNPVWVCNSSTSPSCNTTTMPATLKHLVLQQEVPFGGLPDSSGTDGTVDFQVDWITVDRPG